VYYGSGPEEYVIYNFDMLSLHR